MARSIETIFNAIVAAKDADPVLAGLNSGSKTAIWQLWAYITAVSIHALEYLFDLFKIEVEQTIEQKKPGSLVWYRNKALEFRYGSHLIVDAYGKPSYPASDTNSTLLGECSVTESDTGLIIKLAKRSNETLSPLSQDELDSFITYMKAVKYAGTPIRFISNDAVKLLLQVDVYYDPLLLNGQGKLIISNEDTVRNAVEAYLRALPFDGRIARNDLTSAIRNASGVVDVYINQCTLSFDSNEPKPLHVYHLPESGWFELETLNANYIAYV